MKNFGNRYFPCSTSFKLILGNSIRKSDFEYPIITNYNFSAEFAHSQHPKKRREFQIFHLIDLIFLVFQVAAVDIPNLSCLLLHYL